MQKQLEGTQKYINGSADRVALDGQLMQLLVIHASSGNIVLFNKTAIHLRMFAGFLFNSIFCAATNFGCI